MTWGTNPAMVAPVTEAVPEPATEAEERALRYMGLDAGTPIEAISLDRVFIGSCTNSRIGDLRAAAAVVKGHQVAPNIRAMVVPGSQQVKAPGGGGGPCRGVLGRRLRVARRGVLNVPGHEP